MNIKLVGKNIEVTGAIKEYIEKRAERLEKFEGPNTDMTVVCSVEKAEQVVEIQINQHGEFIRIEERNDDLYASIDLAMDKAERQLRKEKEKRTERKGRDSGKDVIDSFVASANDSKGKITKTKCYEVKPLTLDDAKLKLEERKEDLFMPFVDIDTKEIHVLYKREDGSFGLVIPE